MLIAENGKELQGLLIKVKEQNEKKNMGLKLNIEKSKLMTSGMTTNLGICNEDIKEPVVKKYATD